MATNKCNHFMLNNKIISFRLANRNLMPFSDNTLPSKNIFSIASLISWKTEMRQDNKRCRIYSLNEIDRHLAVFVKHAEI